MPSFTPTSTTDPHTGLPIGLESETHPAPRPERIVHEGRYVRLEPLDPQKHTDDLYIASHGDDKNVIWQYLFEAPFADHAEFNAHTSFRLARKANGEKKTFMQKFNQNQTLLNITQWIQNGIIQYVTYTYIHIIYT